jgi:23S rRNA (cytidine1920-2'-O)/16S rRNA (cytidine1409-2'-O)-methyltransferase
VVKAQKKRLDQILVDSGLADSQEGAMRLIRAGVVYINEEIADKPGMLFAVTAAIRVKEKTPYVSRGGIKLQGALEHFNIQPEGWICADVGASSGGFTDCLLQHGARHVFAIDVAYGQLDWKLRTDHRVTVHERLNIKNINSTHISKKLDLAVFDASFISLTTIIPPILPFFGSVTRILALIKPQFELPRHEVESGGVVKDRHLRLKAIERVEAFGTSQDFQTIGVIPSAIKGPKGNQEYLIYFKRS